MSKSIYEEALEIVDESLYQQDNSVIFNHLGLNLLKKSLEQAQKQEKLLKLYQELDKINGWLLLCFTIGGEEIEKEYYQLGGGNRRHELIKQIKELENEKNNRI